jgi:hypothetical protein
VIQIRLHALPEDTATAVLLLGQLFEILKDSGDRPLRGSSTLCLRHLTVRSLTDPAAGGGRRDGGPAAAAGTGPGGAGTGTQIRALTVRQPWAAAIATGAKTVENRTWSTTYRGTLAIHAAARPDPHALEGTDPVVRGRLQGAYRAAPTAATGTGGLVALADLIDCHRATTWCCRPWGEPEPGVHHWVLTQCHLAWVDHVFEL